MTMLMTATTTHLSSTFTAAVQATETLRAFMEANGCTNYYSLYNLEKLIRDTKVKRLHSRLFKTT